jgi:hypothetical protein
MIEIRQRYAGFYKRWKNKEVPSEYILKYLELDLQKLNDDVSIETGLKNSREYSLEANRLKYQLRLKNDTVSYLQSFKTELQKDVGQHTQSAEPQALGVDEDNHYFMRILKAEHPIAYSAVRNGRAAGIIEYKDGYFNFKCDKGCVGLIFNKAGYTEYKQIGRFILINGEEPGENTLKNCTSNAAPGEWETIEPILFPTMPK